MIGIIDYGAGNLASVQNAIRTLSFDSYIASHVRDIRDDTTIILMPGVGDGSFMMSELIDRKFVDFLQQWDADNKPLLGICVGAQVLLSHTKEGNKDCLNLIEGICDSFFDTFATNPQGSHIKGSTNERLKIPHMGWNEVVQLQDTILFKDIPQNSTYYFVHSYFLSPAQQSHALGNTNYGIDFAAVIGKGNTFGTQFHPEKSGPWGMRLLENFLAHFSEGI